MKFIFLGLIGLILGASSCEKVVGSGKVKNEDVKDSFKLVASYKLKVDEPSGLAIDSLDKFLYTVSDNTNKIYKLSLQGDIIEEFGYIGLDLEGITFVNNQDQILLTEESEKQIVDYNLLTGEASYHDLDYINEEYNSGPEGITYNPDNNSIYFINEKYPGKLFQTDMSFAIKNSYDLSFALDYSGMCYDKKLKLLWIVSDNSRTLNKCSLTGELIKSFPIRIDKAEGIAISNDHKKIYIVSDSTSKLYEYNMPE